jgi:hypothetical protein
LRRGGNGFRRCGFDEDHDGRKTMGRNVTLGIGTLIIILIIVALVF